MTDKDQAYTDLRKHLDRHPIGFPATRSGAEIKVLKHIFSPEEAKIACCLSWRPEPLSAVYARARHLVDSEQELGRILERIQKKGGIESKMKNGERHYCNAPLVVGMYELQVGRLTPEFVRDFKAYTRDKRFGISFLSTELPQMRTIPVQKSLRPEHRVATYDEVDSLLQSAEGPFVILPCICRLKKRMEGKPCSMTVREETCMGFGHMARMIIESGVGREIDRAEALSIIEENQKEGLVLQPSNTRQADFICSCCGCCCGILDIHKHLPRPLEFFASNFQARVDAEACDGCGLCEAHCQVRAVRVAEETQTAAVDLHRCLGCGVCIPECPNKAISLVKKDTDVTPPQTREELHEIIMAAKKGRVGRIKLTVKLAAHAIRTGKIDLLE